MVTSFLSVIYLFAVSGLSCSQGILSLQRTASVAVAHASALAARAWMSKACGILGPRLRPEPVAPTLCVGFPTTGPPGKSPVVTTLYIHGIYSHGNETK